MMMDIERGFMTNLTDTDYTHIQAGIFDLNGELRGKRLPPTALKKLQENGFAMPLSVQNVDRTGADIEDSPFVFETGDKDGQARWTGRGPVPVSWLERAAALMPMSLYTDDQIPFEGCPRAALSAMCAQLAQADITARAGIELEFMILTQAHAPISENPAILSLAELDKIDVILARIEEASHAQNIAYESITSEAGAGQYELVFSPSTELEKLAEDVLLMKHLIAAEAAREGHIASFAAKPLTDQAGNGLHLHLSLEMSDGRNLFAANDALLEQAVAGVLAVLPEASLILSPFPESYLRLAAHSHAPTSLSWGYDNRTVAVRIPNSTPEARRLEVRPASAEANPFLLILTILAAATEGMGLQLEPPSPVDGDSYSQDLPQLPSDFETALSLFQTSERLARYLPPTLFDMFLASKQQDGRNAKQGGK